MRVGVDLSGPEPMYRQIAAILRQRIDAGDYAPNEPIPSETAICEEFDVSRKTARAAVRLLTEAGVTVAAPGKGIYVRPPDAS